MSGPNDVYTTSISGRTKIRTDLDDSIQVITVPQLMQEAVSNFGNYPALSWKKNPTDEWQTMNYRTYEEHVKLAAKAFIKLGLERYHGVCILGFNSPEWFIADLAAIYAGGVAAGIYTTNSSEACYHCLYTSKSNIVVVEDEKQLAKILDVRDRLPHLKAIIQYSGQPTHSDVISWSRIIEMGADETDEQLNLIMNTLVANECCTLVYTSGTVGNPKGVMLSHDNIIYDASVALKCLGLNLFGVDRIISYLPLSHVAAQVLDIYAAIKIKAHIYFADKNALKGTLINTLNDVQPTQFLAVPRVWEKIYEKMQKIAAQNNCLKRTISTWAKTQALNYNMNKMNGIDSPSWGFCIANALVFKRVKQALGLAKCEHFLSSAAPLSDEIKKYFMSLDILIIELYGMSESAGCHTANTKESFRLEGIGRCIPGVEIKIDKPDSEGNGEICMMGRNIFMGYLDDLEKTKDALDDEGWLHSGDIGRIDDNGFYYITGRIKEILITAGGENIPPVLIEQKLKSELPNISNAVLIGDRRKFLSMLITLPTEMDANGAPLDTLTPETIKWLQNLGCEAHTISEVRKNDDIKLRQEIQEAINRVNEKSISNAQRVQKFTILPADFSIPTGELTPTLKIKRSVVASKYSHIIDQLYEDK